MSYFFSLDSVSNLFYDSDHLGSGREWVVSKPGMYDILTPKTRYFLSCLEQIRNLEIIILSFALVIFFYRKYRTLSNYNRKTLLKSKYSNQNQMKFLQNVCNKF